MSPTTYRHNAKIVAILLSPYGLGKIFGKLLGKLASKWDFHFQNLMNEKNEDFWSLKKMSSVKFEKLEIKVLNVLLQHIYLKKN